LLPLLTWGHFNSVDQPFFVGPYSLTKQHSEKNQAHYSIKVSYTKIKSNKVQTASVNDTIQEIIKKQKQTFIKQARQMGKMAPNLQQTDKNTYLNMRYEIINFTPRILSVRFVIEQDFHGAHPSFTYQTLNYALKKHRLIQLAHIFKKKGPYLKRLGQFCRQVLKKRLLHPPFNKKALQQTIVEGTRPKAKNFTNWNFSPKGLLISFPPYQVAAYLHGPQAVLIPRKVYQDLLREKNAL
jgi:hypothetical protein